MVLDVHEPSDAGATFDRLVALCDPVRRDLYFFVVGREGWVSRTEAADALGLRPGLVAHHLDRLAKDGLLDVEHRRLTGRSGPGAGRPAKLYRRTDAACELTIPPRNLGLVGQLLIDAVGRVGRRADPVRRALLDTARDAGVAAGRRSRRAGGGGFADLLGTLGYAPRSADGELSLTNCPYKLAADQDRQLVCSMNLALVEGVMSGIGLEGAGCSLQAPEPGSCCVRVAPWPVAS